VQKMSLRDMQKMMEIPKVVSYIHHLNLYLNHSKKKYAKHLRKALRNISDETVSRQEKVGGRLKQFLASKTGKNFTLSSVKRTIPFPTEISKEIYSELLDVEKDPCELLLLILINRGFFGSHPHSSKWVYAVVPAKQLDFIPGNYEFYYFHKSFLTELSLSQIFF
jgi:hypothetical protein